MNNGNHGTRYADTPETRFIAHIFLYKKGSDSQIEDAPKSMRHSNSFFQKIRLTWLPSSQRQRGHNSKEVSEMAEIPKKVDICPSCHSNVKEAAKLSMRYPQKATKINQQQILVCFICGNTFSRWGFRFGRFHVGKEWNQKSFLWMVSRH